jgi:hypothetical protein
MSAPKRAQLPLYYSILHEKRPKVNTDRRRSGFSPLTQSHGQENRRSLGQLTKKYREKGGVSSPMDLTSGKGADIMGCIVFED